MEDIFRQRILYRGPLKDILTRTCADYGLGDYKDHSIIRRGYEDLNVTIETTEGKLLIKIFKKSRSDQDCRKYVNLMNQAVKNRIKHPPLHQAGDNYLDIIDFGDVYIRLCLMDYIEGAERKGNKISSESGFSNQQNGGRAS